MSPQQVIALGARLLAVWLVVHLPGQVYGAYELVVTGGSSVTVGLRALTVGALLFEMVAVLALWLFPLTIARSLLRAAGEERPPPSSSPDLWLGMGCALIGLWLLATSLPALLLDWFVLAQANSYDETTSLRHSVFYYAAEIAIAAWLLVGARGFRELFWWLRRAGVSKTSG